MRKQSSAAAIVKQAFDSKNAKARKADKRKTAARKAVATRKANATKKTATKKPTATVLTSKSAAKAAPRLVKKTTRKVATVAARPEFDRFRVNLTADCLAHGGGQEYPNEWIGVEDPVLAMRHHEDLDEASKIKAYVASNAGPYAGGENLRYMVFGKPFVVMIQKKGRDGEMYEVPETRTDRKNGMWIPACQLRKVVVTPTAVVTLN